MNKIYSRYDVPKCKGITFNDPTRTQQHFRDETDINKIVARAIQTGDATIFTNAQRGQYYDASTFTDYQDALQIISDVDDDFYSLPSSVRRQFDDDPDAYVAFMSDPRNLDKAVELGLLQGVEKTETRVSSSGTSDPAGAPQTKPPATSSETNPPKSDA